MAAGLFSNQAKTTDKDTRAPVNIYPGTYVGIVKNNADVGQRAGRLWVYIPEFLGEEDNPNSWIEVSYASPFYGVSPHEPPRDDKDSQLPPVTTYGFWAIPPDVGVRVLCTFVKGEQTLGYWFAVIPGLSHSMVPVAGAPDGKTPVMDLNPYDPKNNNDKDISALQRQPYEALTQQYTTQGLAEDPVRGPITTSSIRESPSRVFGISSQSTPEAPGHSFVMDDGGEDGTNKLIRIRTSSGNQITMNDDTGMIYLINAGGTGWVEISPSGQIDVFGAAGINMATNGDVNFHADNNVNIHAGNCVKIVGMKGTKVMGGEELQLHGAKTMIEGVDSLHVHSCKEMMFTSFGDIHMKAFNYFCLKGKCFYWNSCTAKEAEQVPPEQPNDISGYQTTVARAPSKEPYKEHDSGQGGAGAGGQEGPSESDPNVFAAGGGGGAGSPGGAPGGTGGGAGPGGVPGGVGQIYPTSMPNTGGYNVQNIGNVTAGISAMKNADYIKNVTVHWTGNNGDTLNSVISTAKQRNMGYNAYYDPKTKTFYTQNNHLNLRTNGQLSSADGSNNTNTYHIAIIGGAGTNLDNKDVTNIKSYGKDLGTAVGNNQLSIKTHGERNPGHKQTSEGAVLKGPLTEGVRSANVTSTPVKQASTSPAVSTGEATRRVSSTQPQSYAQQIQSKPGFNNTSTTTQSLQSSVSTSYRPGTLSSTPQTSVTRRLVTTTDPSKLSPNVTSQTKSLGKVTNTYKTAPNTSLQGTVNTASGGGTFTAQQQLSVGPNASPMVKTTTYNVAPGPGSSGGIFTSNNPADRAFTGATTTGTNTTVQPTQATLANISTGSQGAGSLGNAVSGSTAPLDPAASGREGRTESELANPDQNKLGETPAQEASQALEQTGGMTPSSDIPAAPGGGNTGCFATGDNCERPVDETGGTPGSADPNANAAQTNYAANDPEGKAAAEAYLGRSMTDAEYSALVAATSAEAGTNQTEQAWVSGTILNRARSSGLTVNQVLNQKGQFEAVTGPGGNANFVRGPTAARAKSINGSMTNILSSVPKTNYYFDAANPAAYKYGKMPTNRGGVAPTQIGASRFYPGANWP